MNSSLIKYAAIILLLSTAFLTGCNLEDSGDVNQDKIWVRYELYYDANNDVTTAIARFRFGSSTGTLLELNENASVTFNDEALTFNKGYFGNVREFAGRIDSGTFVYNDLDGFAFTNMAASYDSIAFPEGFDTISKTQANTLTWDGIPLNANETVGLFIGNWEWDGDALYTQSADSATSIDLSTDQLSSVSIGTPILFMERWTLVPVTEGTSKGGSIIGKYKAENKFIQVVN